ncbi:MAG: DUF2283 domain-containing protein [Planctomycetota bacterium]
MKLTYDPRYNVAYIHLRDKSAEVETIRISDELNVDLAPDGTVYGLELLNANHQLSLGPQGELLVINESSGARTAVKLPA